MTPSPLVSVVVPVRNGERTIGDCVEALLAGDFPAERREIVVVDNASTDRTAEIAARYPVRLVHEPRVGRSHARNRGIAAGQGEIVAFTDADCVAAPAWLRLLVEACGAPGISGAAGEVLPDPPVTAAQRYMARRDRNWQAEVLSLRERFAITANVAFRREVFDRVGLFDPEFVTAEDVDFGWRFFGAGLELVYVPDATVAHRLRAGPMELFRQQAGLGYGRALLRERYDLRPDYALPTWPELRGSARALAAALARRSRGDDLAFAFYEVVLGAGLRAGALRRVLTR